jgi:hypothetical protein
MTGVDDWFGGTRYGAGRRKRVKKIFSDGSAGVGSGSSVELRVGVIGTLLKGIDMALKRLTSGEMIHTTLTWVDTRHRHHQLLAAVPEVGGLLSHLGRAHKGLLDCQPTANPQAAGLARTAEELDSQHDDLVRGGYAVFAALGYLADSPSDREQWLQLRDRVFPEGLAVVSRSYTDEAGQAALAMARLTADDKKLLKSVAFGKTTLLQIIERYGQVAHKLGETATAQHTPAGTPSRADSMAARNQWIRVVNAVLAAIEMVEGNADLLREVVAPLREIERRADRRRTPTEADPETPNPATPTPTPTPTDP